MAAQMKALEQDYEAMKEKFDAAKARYLVVNSYQWFLIVIVVVILLLKMPFCLF